MQIKELLLEDLREYENNPRNNDGAVQAVADSIKEFGFKVPIVIDSDNVIVAGHTRLKAARLLGLETVPCIIADDLTPEQIKAYRLADNKTGEIAEWDFSLLEKELSELSEIDMSAFGFDESIFENIDEYEENPADELEEQRETLQDKFIVPPFSVLDTKQGYWQDRKRIWKKIIKSEEGRSDELLGQGLKDLAEKHGSTLTGTSIFDPVLCEILINWFCPIGGKVLDPFAGGSVRGLVSVLLGNDYTGIDLREEQIKANVKNYKQIANRQDLLGGDLKKPNWITDDSRNIDLLVKEKHDFLLTCPPYADLEVYSDDPRDISNMPYDEFKEAYFEIIQKTCEKLTDNAFAAIVVGEVRDKNGYYYNFIGDTIKAFENAGLKYYNEIILLNAIATAALRANLVFNGGRKVVKTHQNVLIFVKGNEKEIMQNLEKYEYEFEENASE